MKDQRRGGFYEEMEIHSLTSKKDRSITPRSLSVKSETNAHLEQMKYGSSNILVSRPYPGGCTGASYLA